MLIKIQNGTRPGDGRSLCLSCKHSLVVKGDSESETFIECGQMTATRVPYRKVTECSDYMNKGLPSLGDMKEIAWVLVTDRRRSGIGFVAADEWRKNNARREIIPGEYD